MARAKDPEHQPTRRLSRATEELAVVIREARDESRLLALHGDPAAGLIRLRAVASQTIRAAFDAGLQQEAASLFGAAVEAYERRWQGELATQVIPQ